MRRMMAVFCALMLLGAPACACVQRDVALGGSGEDVANAMAVGRDGRIVVTGYTESADGTLSDRTKTGRSGWAACLDAEGKLLWNFCSRHDVRDTMTRPVIHEDGTISVILVSVSGAYEQVSEELIHLSADGNVLNREMIPGEGGILFFVGEDGYVQAETGDTRRRFYLIPWGGTERKLLTVSAADDAQIERASGNYLMINAWENEALYRLEDDLYARPWGDIPEGERYYGTMAALADGGLAIVTYMQDGTWSPEPYLTCWDEQGALVFDRALGLGSGNQPLALCETENGFALVTFYGDLVHLDREGRELETARYELPGDCVGIAQGQSGGTVLLRNWKGDVYCTFIGEE